MGLMFCVVSQKCTGFLPWQTRAEGSADSGRLTSAGRRTVGGVGQKLRSEFRRDVRRGRAGRARGTCGTDHDDALSDTPALSARNHGQSETSGALLEAPQELPAVLVTVLTEVFGSFRSASLLPLRCQLPVMVLNLVTNQCVVVLQEAKGRIIG